MEKLNTSADASGTSWLSDLLLEEIGDCDLFQQCHHEDLLGNEEFLSHDIASVLNQSLSSESYSSYPSETLKNSSTNETNLKRHTNNKKLKTKQNLQVFSPSSSSSSPTSQILSFERNSCSPVNNTSTQFHGFDCTITTLNPKQNEVVPSSSHRNLTPIRKGSPKNQNFETTNPKSQGTKRSHTHAHDHIIAERKRREKLSQSLIALAALIPGLKKMDKASVLGDAIKYVKELQERVRVLEEGNKNSVVESVVTVNKPEQSCDDHSSSSDEGCEAVSGNRETLPHVEAKVLGKEVLFRIHCQKQNGPLLKILMEIQNLHLFVVNSSVLPFGDSILDITIVAQMGDGYKLSRDDLVKNLRVAALRTMS